MTERSAVDDLPDGELLSYYKTRIHDFESERGELLKKIDALAVDQKELHRLEWENKQRTGEIWQLQQSFSEANNSLFEERERLLKLQAENDDLKLKEAEDRKKMQYLLSLTHPQEQEITYLRNTKPDAVEIRPGQQRRGERHKGALLRTVYLPTANADALILKVESLQTQLNEQRQICAERVDALLHDKRVNEEKMSNHRLNYEQQIEIASHKIQRLEEMLRNCTRDYIQERRRKQEHEERAMTAECALKQTKGDLTNKISQLKDRAAGQLHKIQRSTQETIDTYLLKFQEQIEEKHIAYLDLEKTFGVAREGYESRIEELEEKIQKLATTNARLEHRRSLDMEGFVNEVSLLRKKVSVVDRRLHQMRLIERLSEDDRLDRMLQDLENKMPDLGVDEESYSVKLCSSAQLAEEMAKIQSSLSGIEEKIKRSKNAM